MKRLGLVAVCVMLLAPTLTTPQAPADAADAKLPTSFSYYYPFEPKGWCHWAEIDDKTWLEHCDGGQESRFAIKGTGTVENCRGLLMARSDQRMQVFVPDDACSQQLLMTQQTLPGQPPGKWGVLGTMQRASYVRNDVPLKIPGQ